jgi:hypothetical protein
MGYERRPPGVSPVPLFDVLKDRIKALEARVREQDQDAAFRDAAILDLLDRVQKLERS